MRGGVTIDWLLAHPDWYDTVDICSIAFNEAEEVKAEQAKNDLPQ